MMSVPRVLFQLWDIVSTTLISIYVFLYDVYANHFSSGPNNNPSYHQPHGPTASSFGMGGNSDPKNLCGRTVRLTKVSVKVESLLGEGGFAYVYLCRGDGGETKYALKVSNMSGVEQARKERDLGMRMESSINVCGVVDFGENIRDVRINRLPSLPFYATTSSF